MNRVVAAQLVLPGPRALKERRFCRKCRPGTTLYNIRVSAGLSWLVHVQLAPPLPLPSSSTRVDNPSQSPAHSLQEEAGSSAAAAADGSDVTAQV